MNVFDPLDYMIRIIPHRIDIGEYKYTFKCRLYGRDIESSRRYRTAAIATESAVAWLEDIHNNYRRLPQKIIKARREKKRHG